MQFALNANPAAQAYQRLTDNAVDVTNLAAAEAQDRINGDTCYGPEQLTVVSQAGSYTPEAPSRHATGPLARRDNMYSPEPEDHPLPSLREPRRFTDWVRSLILPISILLGPLYTWSDSTTVRNWFTNRDGCTGWTSETGNVAASKTGTVSQEPPQPPTPGTYINPGGHICTNYTGCSVGAVRWCIDQSGHGNATLDGSSSLYDECANVTTQYPHGNCSPGCPCTWTPDDAWRWLNNPSANTYTPNITAE